MFMHHLFLLFTLKFELSLHQYFSKLVWWLCVYNQSSFEFCNHVSRRNEILPLIDKTLEENRDPLILAKMLLQPSSLLFLSKYLCPCSQKKSKKTYPKVLSLKPVSPAISFIIMFNVEMKSKLSTTSFYLFLCKQ